MPVEVGLPADAEALRGLPHRIEVPVIRGEMLRLRPASPDDLPVLDQMDAFFNASGITGKGPVAERAIVHEWVRRSVAWSQGSPVDHARFGDPESRRTIAWSILSDAPGDRDDRKAGGDGSEVIGMIFLIDVDGWSRSARIQIVLGRDYRGRGYSRDAMPRVMTYGFASAPVGLGLHRIWVGVPEKNTRSLSVYQSLGFVPSGTARDGLWDAETGKYQDLIVMDTLVDEYDPIRSLDAFGMHVIEDNPGVQEAMSAHEHSLAIRQHGVPEEHAKDARTGRGRRSRHDADAPMPPKERGSGSRQDPTVDAAQERTGARGDRGSTGRGTALASDARPSAGADSTTSADDAADGASWPASPSSPKRSEGAWWRILGRGRGRGDSGRGRNER
ncbi:GNAT family N-acetyltransferase [uncultured Bifidobacterium sp.]|uniref:GNAT family N-acetyltransferase n=1 Tax=uncultured Bifidobacterium sp. TaxID=165187 RepID=UPI0028DD31AB|nr:GNAT family N-acetyltransferase [uncultured Bifidobacterium sp.]